MAGIASDPVTGNVYVEDPVNFRINVFSVWGTFLQTWGWGVADGSPELQSCGPAASPPTETCKVGIKGIGAGQIDGSAAFAADSAGNLYAFEARDCSGGETCVASGIANRVQKFAPDGSFVLMFGLKVNQTKVAEREAQEAAAEPVTVTPQQENLCTAASSDTCGRGIEGNQDGAFGSGALANNEAPAGQIAIGPGDVVFVGGQERIQHFSSAGTFLGKISIPGEQVSALGVAPDSSVFVGYAFPNTNLGALKGELTKLGAGGEILCTAEVPSLEAGPWGFALTVTQSGEAVTAYGKGREAKVRRFSPNCAEDPSAAFQVTGLSAFATVSGLSTGSACGLNGDNLYVAASEFRVRTFVRAYYPNPDPTICPPPPVAPTIAAQYATSVRSTSAEVKADINPHFWPDTTYHLEWGKEDCKESPSGCENTALLPGATLKAKDDVPAATPGVLLPGLEPDTTYHFRFVAESGGGGPVFGEEGEEDATFHTYSAPLMPKACPNQSFRTSSQAALPDCRAYEMVSPVDKQGGDIQALVELLGPPAAVQQSATNGETFTYSAFRAFANPQSSPYTSQYLARRGSEGWSTEAISPYQEGPRQTGNSAAGELETSYQGFTEDLCSGWIFRVYEPALESTAIPGYPNLYRRGNCGSETGVYEALTRAIPQVEKAPGEFVPLKVDHFLDLGLRGFSADGSHAVFLTRGQIGGQGSPCGPTEVAEPGSNCPMQLFDFHDGVAQQVCVEPNGTRITSSCFLGAGSPRFDIRSNSAYHAVSNDGSRIFWGKGESSEGSLPLYVRIDGEETLPVSTAPALFWTAAADGARAIFSVPGTTDSLYEFDVDTQTKTRIAKDATGVMGASEDATKVYFTSPEVLAGAAANSVGATPQAGKQNLYLHDAVAETNTFIATLHPQDVEGVVPGVGTGPVAVALKPLFRLARVSPSGSSAAFMSYAPLTGADNVDAKSGKPDGEVFLFDADSNRLRCVSCNAGGARPVGRAVDVGGGVFYSIASRIQGWANQNYPSHVLSDSGDRLFFESTNALVLRDTNGKQDVYEWEAGESQRECEEVGAEHFLRREGGCLSLISSGESPSDSEFVDASADGRDVFVSTNASLLPQDPGQRDIYDARAGGGFPPPPGPPAACDGDACLGPLSAPNDPTPASATFKGAGNLVEKKAAKKKKKKQQAKKHKKKGKAKAKRAARNRGGQR